MAKKKRITTQSKRDTRKYSSNRKNDAMAMARLLYDIYKRNQANDKIESKNNKEESDYG